VRLRIRLYLYVYLGGSYAYARCATSGEAGGEGWECGSQLSVPIEKVGNDLSRKY
jgi:hypothetical protein